MSDIKKLLVNFERSMKLTNMLTDASNKFNTMNAQETVSQSEKDEFIKTLNTLRTEGNKCIEADSENKQLKTIVDSIGKLRFCYFATFPVE